MDVSGRLFPVNINPNNFPAKLWRLVSNPAIRSIFWDSQGEAIVINRQLFEREILSPVPPSVDRLDTFKTKNFSSFVRQLNLYGFRKVDPASRDSSLPSEHCSTYYHFSNPNFKRSNPALVTTLRRLTVENKAKLQIGLKVSCRPPTRRQRSSWCDNGDRSERRVSPLQSAALQDSLYCLNKAPAVVAHHNGAPVRPRYLISDTAHSSPLFTKGITMSSGGHYASLAPGSNALHIQQSLFANAVNPLEIKPQPASQVFQCFQPNAGAPHLNGGHYAGLAPGSNALHIQQSLFANAVNPLEIKQQPASQVFQCSQPNPVAPHLNGGLFSSPSMLYQATYPVPQMCHDDFKPEDGQELQACDADLNTIFPDDISLSPLCS